MEPGLLGGLPPDLGLLGGLGPEELERGAEGLVLAAVEGAEAGRKGCVLLLFSGFLANRDFLGPWVEGAALVRAAVCLLVASAIAFRPSPTEDFSLRVWRNSAASLVWPSNRRSERKEA